MGWAVGWVSGWIVWLWVRSTALVAIISCIQQPNQFRIHLFCILFTRYQTLVGKVPMRTMREFPAGQIL